MKAVSMAEHDSGKCDLCPHSWSCVWGCLRDEPHGGPDMPYFPGQLTALAAGTPGSFSRCRIGLSSVTTPLSRYCGKASLAVHGSKTAWSLNGVVGTAGEGAGALNLSLCGGGVGVAAGRQAGRGDGHSQQPLQEAFLGCTADAGHPSGPHPTVLFLAPLLPQLPGFTAMESVFSSFSTSLHIKLVTRSFSFLLSKTSQLKPFELWASLLASGFQTLSPGIHPPHKCP